LGSPKPPDSVGSGATGGIQAWQAALAVLRRR
jgi:hypothetical protein